MTDEASPFAVLLVCTGNICRSALAERLGRAFLLERTGESAASIRLASAGTRAVAGSAMHPDSALVLQGLGAVAGDFRARQFDPRMADDADLVLTMTRDHRRQVLRAAPRALQRTFTLREAAALLELLGPAPILSGDDLAQQARDLVEQMAAARTQRRAETAQHDIEDPIGRSPETHEAVGEAIAAALLPVLARIADLGHPPVGSSARCDARGTGG